MAEMTAQEAIELLNLKYKVWQREELEQLKERIQQQQQQIEQQAKRLEAAENVCSLAKYSQHDFNCDYITPRMIDEPCSCGAWRFNKALQNWKQEKEAQ